MLPATAMLMLTVMTMMMMVMTIEVHGHQGGGGEGGDLSLAKKGQYNAILEEIFDAEKRVKNFFGGMSSSSSSSVHRRGFAGQQALNNFGTLCNAADVEKLIAACPASATETSCTSTCSSALNAASKKTQQCASVFATDRPWQYLQVRCQTVGTTGSCATTLNRLADPEPSFNCASQSVSNCDQVRCLVFNGECRDRVNNATLEAVCNPCVDTLMQELTSAVSDLKQFSDATNGMQRYQIAKFATDVVEVQSALQILCARANPQTFCTPIMQELDAAFAQRYTQNRYVQICEEYTPLSMCATKIENIKYSWNVQQSATQLIECQAERTKFQTPAPPGVTTTIAPITTASPSSTTTTAAPNATTNVTHNVTQAPNATNASTTTTTTAAPNATNATNATTTTNVTTTTTTAAATTTTTAGAATTTTTTAAAGTTTTTHAATTTTTAAAAATTTTTAAATTTTTAAAATTTTTAAGANTTTTTAAAGTTTTTAAVGATTTTSAGATTTTTAAAATTTTTAAGATTTTAAGTTTTTAAGATTTTAAGATTTTAAETTTTTAAATTTTTAAATTTTTAAATTTTTGAATTTTTAAGETTTTTAAATTTTTAAGTTTTTAAGATTTTTAAEATTTTTAAAATTTTTAAATTTTTAAGATTTTAAGTTTTTAAGATTTTTAAATTTTTAAGATTTTTAAGATTTTMVNATNATTTTVVNSTSVNDTSVNTTTGVNATNITTSVNATNATTTVVHTTNVTSINTTNITSTNVTTATTTTTHSPNATNVTVIVNTTTVNGTNATTNGTNVTIAPTTTPTPTRKPETPRPTVSVNATCEDKFSFQMTLFEKEHKDAVRCERRAGAGYCQLMFHTEMQNASFVACLNRTGCGTGCESILREAVDRLDCCVTNLNVTDQIEELTRGCGQVNARVRSLMANGPCTVVRSEVKVPIEIALPIKWSVIANDAAMQRKIVESSTRDVSNAIGLDPQFIVDGRLERDATTQVSSSAARRRLLQTEAGTRFKFNVQATNSAITTSAASQLTQLLKSGVSLPTTAALVATECPHCGNPALLLSVRAPVPSTNNNAAASGFIVSLLMMLVATIVLVL
jgi:hypothetical protein